MNVGTDRVAQALAATPHAARLYLWRLPVHIARALATCIAEERDRWILWTPVIFGCGIAIYFALEFEPASWLGPAMTGMAALALALSRRVSVLMILCLGVFIASAGFTTAQVRSHLVAAPVLDREIGPVRISGRVIEIQNLSRGPRILLDQLHIPRIETADTPKKARIRLHRDSPVAIGKRTTVLAKLSPPPAPVFPGAYDFQRRVWFDRIGAVGFALSRTKPTEESVNAEVTATISVGVWLARLRHTIAERIRSAEPGPEGAIAAALITGDRSAIPPNVIDAVRDVGLAHLLAISGLHMGLVAATIFFGVRALLALWEHGALRYPVKKWAAVAAIAGSFAYLLLSGMTIPTQRAFLMTGLVLLAVIFDRTAISLRLVAWAAMIILILVPESILGASFQMSFAAVVVLVAAYEILRRPVGAWLGRRRLWRRVVTYFVGVATTTLLASVATGVIALFHFNRIAPSVWRQI